MKRREARRNMQVASRKETSEYRQMSSNVNGNFSFILQRAAERDAGIKQTPNTSMHRDSISQLFLREQSGLVSFGAD